MTGVEKRRTVSLTAPTFGSHALPRCRSAACRRRCAMARLANAVKDIQKTGRDVGLAESGFAYRSAADPCQIMHLAA
jgi:hypothetical protein